MHIARLMVVLREILRGRSSNTDRDQHSVQAEDMDVAIVSRIQSSSLETDVLKFCKSMAALIGMNLALFQLKSNSFNKVLTCIEIFMSFFGLMIYILHRLTLLSTCLPRQTKDVVSWILYWIPITCAPLMAIPMISFCIPIGGAVKITILIIGYIVLVATNFSQLRSMDRYMEFSTDNYKRLEWNYETFQRDFDIFQDRVTIRWEIDDHRHDEITYYLNRLVLQVGIPPPPSE